MLNILKNKISKSNSSFLVENSLLINLQKYNTFHRNFSKNFHKLEKNKNKLFLQKFSIYKNNFLNSKFFNEKSDNSSDSQQNTKVKERRRLGKTKEGEDTLLNKLKSFQSKEENIKISDEITEKEEEIQTHFKSKKIDNEGEFSRTNEDLEAELIREKNYAKIVGELRVIDANCRFNSKTINELYEIISKIDNLPIEDIKPNDPEKFIEKYKYDDCILIFNY